MCKQIILLAVVGIFVGLFPHNHLNAENIEIEKTDLSTISWGDKYFFDAPRFKDDNIRELLDAAIEDKLKTYGIKITEGNSVSKYVLHYTLVLEENASQLEVKDLYEHEPELKDSSDEVSNFEHGKFMISIRDRESREAFWRNNIQGIAGLDMSVDVRQQRIHNFVEQVFENFPVDSNNTQNEPKPEQIK